MLFFPKNHINERKKTWPSFNSSKPPYRYIHGNCVILILDDLSKKPLQLCNSSKLL